MKTWPNFTYSEFACKATGENKMDPEFIDKLQDLRTLYGKPLRVSSGYRSPKHPIEAAKPSPGAHSSGKAVDFAVEGADAHRLLRLAMHIGFKGVGVQQKGSGRFIHLDDWDERTTPALWSY